MPSPQQLTANRTNALKSTGPKSKAGKSRSALNALKHGLHANHDLLPGDDYRSYFHFNKEIHEELRPHTILEHCLVDQIISVLWRLRRIARIEQHVITLEDRKITDPAETSLAPISNLQSPATPPPLDVIAIMAHAFSENPDNPLPAVQRYERSLRSSFLRLMETYRQYKTKKIPNDGYHDDDLWEAFIPEGFDNPPPNCPPDPDDSPDTADSPDDSPTLDDSSDDLLSEQNEPNSPTNSPPTQENEPIPNPPAQHPAPVPPMPSSADSAPSAPTGGSPMPSPAESPTVDKPLEPPRSLPTPVTSPAPPSPAAQASEQNEPNSPSISPPLHENEPIPEPPHWLSPVHCPLSPSSSAPVPPMPSSAESPTDENQYRER